MEKIEGNIIDIHKEEIFPGIIYFSQNGIDRIEKINKVFNHYILPGLIDSHVHIESSMLVPSNFSRLVVPRGTIGVVTDPHEIGNVLGVKGVEYMIEESKNTPLKCFFGAPSCVPATPLESSGAEIDSGKIESLLDKEDVFFLSEMMNFPGVINGDKEVLAKLDAAKKRNLPIDGHAPGLKGKGLEKYAAAGVSTDHECFELDEALEKISNRIKIQIREGSAAKNFNALTDLFDMHPDQLMLCTDDSHPDELIHSGHIDKLIKLGLKKGIDLFKLLQAASLIPVRHYNLPVGLLRKSDPADFIVIDNPADFNVLESYINGKKVYHRDQGLLFERVSVYSANQFLPHFIVKNDLLVRVPEGAQKATIIKCFEGELVTDSFQIDVSDQNYLTYNTENDILKLVVIDRYQNKPVSVGFINGFGLKKGAIASSVAHDSHNVVAIGTNDEDLVNAINVVMENKGGLAVTNQEYKEILPLPVAGLMSDKEGEEVAKLYSHLEEKAKGFGAKLKAPFMTLSFMSLLVIPKLKLGDKGLFDGEKFEFISIFE
ncbi:adenine deaminase [Marinilabilia rubra]|uniref:Adenine deaminase n=1 Tax=Marinilabilia rubra TaxID=2162893 RepID=A0A2U2B9H9_9BACT|nr:adenine deaminase [Marinilabilia rubra]PWD99729.1 adenine deaminase [Marinilabilia rubra]